MRRNQTPKNGHLLRSTSPAAAGAVRDGGCSWACGRSRAQQEPTGREARTGRLLRSMGGGRGGRRHRGLFAMGAVRGACGSGGCSRWGLFVGPAAAGAVRDGGCSWGLRQRGLFAMGAVRGACGSGGCSRWGLFVGLRQEQGPAGADRPGGTNRPVAAQHGRWPGWPEAPGAGHAPADVRAGRRGRKPGTAEPTEQGTARTGLKGQTGGCRMLAAERTMQTRPVERNLGGWVGQPWQDAAGACSW